jgi:hypothetical protein
MSDKGDLADLSFKGSRSGPWFYSLVKVRWRILQNQDSKVSQHSKRTIATVSVGEARELYFLQRYFLWKWRWEFVCISKQAHRRMALAHFPILKNVEAYGCTCLLTTITRPSLYRESLNEQLVSVWIKYWGVNEQSIGMNEHSQVWKKVGGHEYQKV